MATQPLQPDNPDRPLIAKSAREGGPPRGPRLRVSDVRIAVIMLIGTETMFFSGLIAAYLVLRGATPAWPPADQPLLPIAVTLANTVILLASAVTMHLALRAARQGAGARLVNALMVTGLLGLLFVVIQGSEWVGLVRHGLTLESSTYVCVMACVVRPGLPIVRRFSHLRARRDGPAGLDSAGLGVDNHPMKTASRALLGALAVSVLIAVTPGLSEAQGCAMCGTVGNGPDDPLVKGMFRSIMFLVAMPFAVVGSIGGWLAYNSRRTVSGTELDSGSAPIDI